MLVSLNLSLARWTRMCDTHQLQFLYFIAILNLKSHFIRNECINVNCTGCVKSNNASKEGPHSAENYDASLEVFRAYVSASQKEGWKDRYAQIYTKSGHLIRSPVCPAYQTNDFHAFSIPSSLR